MIFINFLHFPFPSLKLYTIWCPSESFPCKIFTVYCNKHNQHSLSLTTLAPSTVLATPIHTCYLQQSEHCHSFPNSHDRRQLTVIMLSEYGWKCSWHINVREQYWMISVDWNQNFSLCNFLCLPTISTYLHWITFVNQHRYGGRIPYWLGRSR